MYNGIGLSTARGSGTNGYVQRNLALVRTNKSKSDYRSEEDLKKLEQQLIKGPNAEIREHDRKRKLELKCLEMEDRLKEQGLCDADVSDQVSEFRAMLIERDLNDPKASQIERDQFGKPIVRETHAIAEAQHEKNVKLKEAFGISKYFIEGSSLDPHRQVKEEAARQAELQQVTAEAHKKYNWVRTPSPSPERSREKEKKKKKKRSRDRSSSAESRRKHKSKKSKRSRSTSPKRKKRSHEKKKKEKPKKRYRSSSNSSSSSASSPDRKRGSMKKRY